MTNLMPEIVPGRIKVKPRPYGITMMLDRCQGLNATKDLIHMAGEYLDQIKLSFGTAMLVNEAFLRDKIDLVVGKIVSHYALSWEVNINSYYPGILAEVLEFGKDYAVQTVKNAKALAVALNDLGFKVLGEKNGFTQSHQTVVNVLDYGDGGKIEADLEKANIIVNRQLIPGDIKAKRHYMHPGGIRLGTSEVTRLGMKESEMKQIASFIKNVVVDNKDTKDIAKQIAELRKTYQKTQYCFDNKLGAYEYVKLR